MPTRSFAALCLIVLGAAVNPGCECPNGLATQKPSTGHLGDTVVNCTCNLDFNYLHDPDVSHSSCWLEPVPEEVQEHKSLKFCLPPELNAALPNNPNTPGIFDMGEAAFNDAVDQYCQTAVTNILFHIAAGTEPATCGFCAEKASRWPQGGIAGSVHCFKDGIYEDGDAGLAATAFEPTCTSPCGNTECDFSSTGNCSMAAVVNGGFNPAACQCNQVSQGACDVDGGTSVFCGPMPNNADPPALGSSPVSILVSHPIEIELDPTASSLTMTIAPGAESDTHTVAVRGTIMFYGDPCPGADCDRVMGLNLYPQDFSGANHFHFTVAPDETMKGISLFGGTQSRKAHFHADGSGTIVMGDLQMTAHAEQIEDGALSHKDVQWTAATATTKDVNFSLAQVHNGLFTLGPAKLSGGDSFTGADATLTLTGHIKNLPPIARAGSYPVLECTSPQGAQVTLDASGSSDPDGDFLSLQWYQGGPYDTKLAASGPRATVEAPIGTTNYSVVATDTSFVLTFDEAAVTVQDTLPPEIVGSVDPACLWPVDHTMVLYQIGNGLDVHAVDACDTTPDLRIVNVVSNQPPLGGGSGNMAPDVVFGPSSLCVRAERDGTVRAERTYTVTVEARDHHGNVVQKDFVISVPHDQGGGRCAHPDATRIVADDDPRCNAPSVTSPLTPLAPGNLHPENQESIVPGSPGACSMGGRSAATPWASLAMIALLFVLRARRLGILALLIFGSVVLSACSQGSSQDVVANLQGWWRDPQPDACICPAQAECAAGDCKAFSFMGFASTQYFNGTFTWSAADQSMSSEGTLSSGTIAVNGNQLVLTRSTGEVSSFAVTAGGSQMTLNGAAKVKVSSDFATALAPLASAMSPWRHQSIGSAP